jgi:hypothetical protein
MKFNRQNKTLFLDPNSDVKHQGDEKLDVILSPSLYWVKKISLPVNSLREVRKLLPSIFEEILPDGIYSYSAYKTNDDSKFYIFAYEDKKILDALSKQNISMANVSTVHFAQSELQYIKHAMKINDTQNIYVKDDIVVLVPCCYIEEKGVLDVSSMILSKHKITLQQFGHIIDYKSLYSVASVLLVLIILVFGELFITTQRLENIADKKDEIFSKNNLKSTMFENKAILKKYKNIHKDQTRFREYFSYLLALKLNSSEKMTLFSLKNRIIEVSFSGTIENKTSHITSVLKSKGVKFTQKHKNGILHLEIKL